jgi:Zonular occludens toxin (Zot)
MVPSGGPTVDPGSVVNGMGAIMPWIVAMAAVLGALYVLATMLAGVSTMRYAIVGFFGRRGQGKSFSCVYYARKWGQRYRDKDVWTNMARLDIEGRVPCIGEVRKWDPLSGADGRKKEGFTLRHHVHNQRDCWECAGNPSGHEHSEARCFTCTLQECQRPIEAPVTKDKKTGALYCEFKRAKPAVLCHVESEYLDFAHAYDGLVVVDEAGQIFASTMWAKLPYAALKFMADTRKRRILMLYSAHTPARVSKNLRELTDEAFTCESWKGFGFFRLKHYEGCLVEQDQVTYVPFLKTVQHSYDTEEIVTPPGGLVSMSEAVGRREVKLNAQSAVA